MKTLLLVLMVFLCAFVNTNSKLLLIRLKEKDGKSYCYEFITGKPKYYQAARDTPLQYFYI